MKKWLAILLATVLVLGLGTAMAADMTAITAMTGGTTDLQTTVTADEVINVVVSYTDVPTYTYTWTAPQGGGASYWVGAATGSETITVSAKNNGSATKKVKAGWQDASNLDTAYGLSAAGTGSLFTETNGVSLAPNAGTDNTNQGTLTVTLDNNAVKAFTTAPVASTNLTLGTLTITITNP